MRITNSIVSYNIFNKCNVSANKSNLKPLPKYTCSFGGKQSLVDKLTPVYKKACQNLDKDKCNESLELFQELIYRMKKSSIYRKIGKQAEFDYKNVFCLLKSSAVSNTEAKRTALSSGLAQLYYSFSKGSK